MNCRKAALVFLLLGGCVSSTSKPEPAPSTRFRLTVPSQRATILHGTTRPYEVTLDRDVDFTSPITLEVEVDPPEQGVTARMDPTRIDATTRAAKLVVTVSEFAHPGDYTLHLTGHADGSPSTTVDVALTVPPKDGA